MTAARQNSLQLQGDGVDLAVGVRTLPSCRRWGVPGERCLATLLDEYNFWAPLDVLGYSWAAKGCLPYDCYHSLDVHANKRDLYIINVAHGISFFVDLLGCLGGHTSCVEYSLGVILPSDGKCSRAMNAGTTTAFLSWPTWRRGSPINAIVFTMHVTNWGHILCFCYALSVTLIFDMELTPVPNLCISGPGCIYGWFCVTNTLPYTRLTRHMSVTGISCTDGPYLIIR